MCKRKKSSVLVLLSMVVSFGIMILAYSPTSVQAKTWNLKYAGFMDAENRMENTMVWYAKELEKRTNGSIKVTLYHSGALGAIRDFPKMLRAGIADLAQVPLNYSDMTPILSFTNAPFVLTDERKTPDAFWAVYNEGLLKELDDFKPLWFNTNDTFHFMFRNKKITKVEQFKGLKMRGAPGMQAAMMEALGATPVALPTAEVYTGVERGIVDGYATALTFVASIHLDEITKYLCWGTISTGGNVMSMTKKLWNSFPSDIQAIIMKLNNEAQSKFWEFNEVMTIDDAKKLNWEVYEMSPEEREKLKKVVEPIIDTYMKKYEDKGLPIRRAVEIMRQFN